MKAGSFVPLSMVGFLSSLLACGRPADPRVPALEARVHALEKEVIALREQMAPAQQPTATDGESDESVANGSLPHSVAFELGDVELHGSDSIEIQSIRGDRPHFEVGGIYIVRGRYRLDTHAAATMLLSVTGSAPTHSPGRAAPSARRKVTRGEGEFVLVKRLTHPGTIHLTFYRQDTGAPFGGVYFGAGEWLLRKKSWRYEAPSNATAPSE